MTSQAENGEYHGELYSKENLDDILRELGKTFRRLNGKTIPAEMILIGGAAIIASYEFRAATTDIDALIQASSAMKDAINQVGDHYGFSRDWLNQDFRKTASYSDKIVQYSVPYRTFSNILHVRTLPAEYIIAMKLCSFREYKYDKSDVIGLIKESGVSRAQIEQAVSNLYGNWDYLARGEWASRLLDEVYEADDLENLYAKYREEEQSSFELLKQLDEQYDDLLTRDNVNSVIAAAKKARKNKK